MSLWRRCGQRLRRRTRAGMGPRWGLAFAGVFAVSTLGACGTRSSLNVLRVDANMERRDAAVEDIRDGMTWRRDTLPEVCKAWRCWEEGARTFCGNPQSPGLPGIGFWSCELLLAPRRPVPTWRCDGSVPKGGLVTPVVPCSATWRCEMIGTNALHDLYRCEKPDDDRDRPPPALLAGRHAVCMKGSTWGTLCELTREPVTTAPWSVESAGAPCRPGELMWCAVPAPASGRGGWGQVSCAKDGHWARRPDNPLILDCRRRDEGRVPDTLCACYFRVNPTPSCCERVDCVVPPRGEAGRRCDPSPGTLCDTCNPMASECAAGAACVVNGEGESYCARPCESAPCPSAFTCNKLEHLSTRQCIPDDLSCYF